MNLRGDVTFSSDLVSEVRESKSCTVYRSTPCIDLDSYKDLRRRFKVPITIIVYKSPVEPPIATRKIKTLSNVS